MAKGIRITDASVVRDLEDIRRILERRILACALAGNGARRDSLRDQADSITYTLERIRQRQARERGREYLSYQI